MNVLSIIANSGPFGLLAIVLGTAGICLSVAQGATGRRFDQPAAVLAALALLTGLAGSSLGLLIADQSLQGSDLDPVRQAAVWRHATAVAGSATLVGAVAAGFDLAAMAIVRLWGPTTE